MAVVPQLVDQPGAFVREAALHARMLAAHEHRIEVTLEFLQQSVDSLLRQIRSGNDFLQQRRPIGLLSSSKPAPTRKVARTRSPFGSHE
jgi:hypothetical protein